MAFAAHQLWLNAPVGPAITRAEALAAVAKARGGALLNDGPPLPGTLAHVWRWFAALASCYGEAAPGRPAEIAADVAALTGIGPTGFETDLLLRLFALRRQAGAETTNGIGNEDDGNGDSRA